MKSSRNHFTLFSPVVATAVPDKCSCETDLKQTAARVLAAQIRCASTVSNKIQSPLGFPHPAFTPFSPSSNPNRR
ncbi:MAG: hypothetical protein LBB51_05730, partial [Zoogloeaceae bacterium]|nr:hypothetical protein [Zoogloeaceae bacterium]